jgi:hypothetical protein
LTELHFYFLGSRKLSRRRNNKRGRRGKSGLRFINVVVVVVVVVLVCCWAYNWRLKLIFYWHRYFMDTRA